MEGGVGVWPRKTSNLWKNIATLEEVVGSSCSIVRWKRGLMMEEILVFGKTPEGVTHHFLRNSLVYIQFQINKKLR